MPPVADYPPLSSRSGGLLTRLWRPAHASRSSGGRPAVSAVSPSMPSIAQYRPVLPSIPCLACDRAPARTLPMLSWHGGGGAEEGRGVYGFVGMRWYGRLHIRVLKRLKGRSPATTSTHGSAACAYPPDAQLAYYSGGGEDDGRGIYGVVGMRWYGRLPRIRGSQSG